MNHMLPLDEYSEVALKAELQLREARRQQGLCDYCGRPPTATPCKYLDRHTDPRPVQYYLERGTK